MGLTRKRVIITKRAKRSIREIYYFIKEREKSSTKAHYVRQALIDKCRSLKDFSGYSKERFLGSYTEDYRSVRIWSYIIIFLQSSDEVQVLNIVHSHQHPKSRDIQNNSGTNQ